MELETDPKPGTAIQECMENLLKSDVKDLDVPHGYLLD